MTLSSYYKTLPKPIPPKTAFIKRIAKRCNVNESTVRNWVKGRGTPEEEKHLDIISEETNIPKDQLFKK